MSVLEVFTSIQEVYSYKNLPVYVYRYTYRCVYLDDIDIDVLI